MDKGAWWATVRGYTKTQTQLKRVGTHTFLAIGYFSVLIIKCILKVFSVFADKFPFIRGHSSYLNSMNFNEAQ